MRILMCDRWRNINAGYCARLVGASRVLQGPGNDAFNFSTVAHHSWQCEFSHTMYVLVPVYVVLVLFSPTIPAKLKILATNRATGMLHRIVT